MSKLKAAEKTFEYFYERLLKGFRSVENREPNNLEMILIRQEAGNKARDAAKVIEVDFGKPFSKEIEAMIKSGDVKVGKADKTPPYQKSQADIEFEIMEKINSDNAKAIKAFESRNSKNKMSDTEKQFNKDVEEAGGMEAFLNANPISGTSTKRYFKGVEIKDPTFDETLPFDNDAEKLAEIKMSNEAYDMEKARGTEPKNKLKFRLNKERFKKDFNVTDEEVEKISILSPEDQQKKVREYIDKDFKERIELSDYDVTDLEPNAEGGRAGHYTGGMVDVEPSLSDIGHGSDALMARTRLVSPNSQATTSTGLNYLLAEDNDNIRVPFSKGKLADAARRKFMKAAGATGAGIAALKTGLLGLGEKAAPVVEKAVTTVSETAQSVPPYFFNLVKKIKNLGEDTMATQDKTNAYKFKDYVMEEDFAGNITIIKKNMDDPYPEEVIMSYKVDDVNLPSGKGMAKVDEYEEFTVRPDRDGKMKDIEGGVPDEVVQEGTMFEDTMTEFGKTKKASGGLAKMLGE